MRTMNDNRHYPYAVLTIAIVAIAQGNLTGDEPPWNATQPTAEIRVDTFERFAGEWTGPELINGVPQDGTILHGDILISPAAMARGATPTLWPEGNVYFQFDVNMTSSMRNNILSAMDRWNHGADANVRFLPRYGQPNYVHIRNSGNDADPRNNSFVGMVGGEQILNIFSHNSVYTAAHELAHAVGFWHEQSRPDRDDFVLIQEANIQDGSEHNFNIQCCWPDNSWDTPYDFLSIMHYGQCFFSISSNCPAGNTETIIVLPPHQPFQDDIGNNSSFGTHDAEDMRNVYGFGRSYYIFTSGLPILGNGTLRSPWGRVFPEANFIPASGRNLWIEGGIYENSVGLYGAPVTWAPIPGSGDVILR
ncbi:MAG: M12 family metallopeptidase [Phycisphaerales bacterium]|nr:M12 family metallopeptidase [Phycisphaerales bacterium]